ncbi:MAG: pyridoxal-phosphate dependent enzyme, partial [Thermoplasmata archaeon]
MQVYNNIMETIGNTPIVRINRIAGKDDSIFGKLEFFNPGGSIKDRMAHYIMENAERSGELRDKIVENSSGNTGAAIAMISSVKGKKAIITIP